MVSDIFSFGCKSYKQSGCKGQSQTAGPIKHQAPHLDHKNIRESNLDFTAHFGEINPDMPCLCRRGLSGPKKAVFTFFPLFGESRWKKTLNLSFFAKKQVNFWVVYLLNCKPLIINEKMMMHRKVERTDQPSPDSKQPAKTGNDNGKTDWNTVFHKYLRSPFICYGYVGNMPYFGAKSLLE